MLKSIRIKNFRSLKNFNMEFNSGLNVIIGENDAGKTSLIDSLKILFSKKKIDINDFNEIENPVTIELEDIDYTYFMESKVSEDTLINTYKIKPSIEKANQIKEELESEEFNSLDENDQKIILKKYSSIFNVTFRSNSKVETLKENIIKELEEDEFTEVKTLNYPISFLGSREFENIDSFFENTFFKELKEDIWDYKIEGKTINQYIDEYIETDFTLQDTSEFTRLWHTAIMSQEEARRTFIPSFSQMATVKCFEGLFCEGIVHYANSTAIRLANIYAKHYVYCNRGVNGIEGSLSTAAGFSCVTEEKVFCVIGDLSFFYDQNALWNQNLRGNFRILLLNNGKGGIFNMLKGLEQSPARDKFVSAEHHTTAEGICQQNDVVYLMATNMEEMQQGVDTLLNIESGRPVLLEVLTDAEEDERVFRDYYRSLSN